MEENIVKKIISEYLLGKGSTTISKDLGISKPSILKILREEGIIRKRDRCKQLKILKKDDYYFINRICPKCGKVIETKSKNETIACRNFFNINKGSKNCKKCSLLLQVGEGNPFYGKKHKNESKIKISNSRKGKAVGEKNSMANNEWRQKARKNLINKWKSGDLDKLKLFFSEKMKETIRLGKLKSVIKSKKEQVIINILENLGYDCIGSYKVDTKVCDIYIPSLNLIIEYNGDYWHCNPKIYQPDYFNKKKNLFASDIWKYDQFKLELIKKSGYNLEVIWESDFLDDNKIISNILNKYVTKPISTPEVSKKN